MPEFILNGDTPPAEPPELSDLMAGYIEAWFFCNDGADPNRPHHLNDLGTGRLTRQARRHVRDTCAAFLAANAADLEAALPAYSDGYRGAGRDLYYTQQGHGCGFWDRDDSGTAPEVGAALDRLSAAVPSEFYPYTAKGWIYA